MFRKLGKIYLLIVATFLLISSLNTIKVYAYEDSNLVVVIDAGHGDWDSGAVAYNTMEKDLNLKVAQYMKEELETYNNISVLLTRDDNSYPTLFERSEFAKINNADLFVSVHMNASVNHERSGASVYISKDSFYYQETEALAEKTLENLNSLGIKKEGVLTRKHPVLDSDYYAVIRYNIANDIPAILIEHGYMDNKIDFQYMNSDYNLKRLGVMNARAIADEYRLVKTNLDLWDLWFLKDRFYSFTL